MEDPLPAFIVLHPTGSSIFILFISYRFIFILLFYIPRLLNFYFIVLYPPTPLFLFYLFHIASFYFIVAFFSLLFFFFFPSVGQIPALLFSVSSRGL